MNTRIIRPNIIISKFELNLMMFKILEAIGQYLGVADDDPHP